MEQFDLDKLPILKSFSGLKRGDTVYSKKYGLGDVISPYGKDEIIVSFQHGKKRFTAYEEEISIVPQGRPPKKKTIEVSHAGEKMSFKQFKQMRRQEQEVLERKKKLEEALKANPSLKIEWDI